MEILTTKSGNYLSFYSPAYFSIQRGEGGGGESEHSAGTRQAGGQPRPQSDGHGEGGGQSGYKEPDRGS